jgi:hypothetical protein
MAKKSSFFRLKKEEIKNKIFVIKVDGRSLEVVK